MYKTMVNSIGTEQRVKFVVLGDYSVGKTSLVRSFTKTGEIEDVYTPTIGVDFRSSMIYHEMAKATVKGLLWDTAGQERFNSVISSYVKGVSGVLYVFDVCNRKSFDAIRTKWCEFVMRNHSGGIELAILIGNKTDMPMERQVGSDEAMLFAATKGMVYYETHYRSPNNPGLFKEIVNKVRIQPLPEPPKRERIGCSSCVLL